MKYLRSLVKGEYGVIGWACLFVAIVTLVFLLSIAASSGGEVVLIFVVQPVLIFLTAFVIAFLAVAWHEVGHLLAGRCMGFPIVSLRIGPLQWIRQWDDSLRFNFCRKTSWISGYTGVNQPKSDRRILRYTVFVLGGPIASLILFVAACILLPPTTDRHFLDPLMNIAKVSCGAILALCLVPYREKGIDSDALSLSLLLKPLHRELVVRNQIHINEWMAGMACKDWDAENLRRLLEVAPAKSDHPLLLHDLGLALGYRGETEDGLRYLDEAMTLIEPPSKMFDIKEKAISLDVAFARVTWGNDLAGAESALEYSRQFTVPVLYGTLRAEAAIALAKGQNELCIEKAEAAIAELKATIKTFRPTHDAALAEMTALIERAQSGAVPQRTSDFQVK